MPTTVGYYATDPRSGNMYGYVKTEYNANTGILTLKGTSSGNYYGTATLNIYIIA